MTAIPATAPERATSWLRLVAAARAGGASPASETDRADGSALQGVSVTSVGNGRRLGVQNGSRDDGAYVVTDSAPGHQAWNLAADPADFSFAIVNGTTGKGIDLSYIANTSPTFTSCT
ncbi:RICIN domain-containing protein [Streptomyces sp. IBSNAI002]|uniref:RICIN domain-containing protein n=1 Tax=Streptomyces sp. IBSNAI002 TaxID=3457500 RepID=UPI003FD5750E